MSDRGRAITMVALHPDVSQPSRRTMTSSIGTTLVGSVFVFVPLPVTPILSRRIHPPSAFRDPPLYKLSTGPVNLEYSKEWKINGMKSTLISPVILPILLTAWGLNPRRPGASPTRYLETSSLFMHPWSIFN